MAVNSQNRIAILTMFRFCRIDVKFTVRSAASLLGLTHWLNVVRAKPVPRLTQT